MQRDRVFSAVDNPNNNKEWTDFSVDCFYVGTFEVGEQAKVDKVEVKRGTFNLASKDNDLTCGSHHLLDSRRCVTAYLPKNTRTSNATPVYTRVGIRSMKDFIHGQRNATLIIQLEGIKVIDSTSNKVLHDLHTHTHSLTHTHSHTLTHTRTRSVVRVFLL